MKYEIEPIIGSIVIDQPTPPERMTVIVEGRGWTRAEYEVDFNISTVQKYWLEFDVREDDDAADVLREIARSSHLADLIKPVKE